jgi:hypothetical protein
MKQFFLLLCLVSILALAGGQRAEGSGSGNSDVDALNARAKDIVTDWIKTRSLMRWGFEVAYIYCNDAAPNPNKGPGEYWASAYCDFQANSKAPHGEMGHYLEANMGLYYYSATDIRKAVTIMSEH